MSESEIDAQYMKRCLQLAANGRSTCSPNPMVGAVLVHRDRIIGEGWHRKAGEPHAEPNAIRSVVNPDLLKESTMYVSLEPCSHYGKTPPCADLIIQMGIPRVVVGSLDPFPKVSGRGVARMRAAGVDVLVGVEEAACKQLNRAFFSFHLNKRPYVILKWAQTADGFLDVLRQPGDSQQALKISTAFTQMLVHKLRSECDAILVGTNTALLDNPSLTVRSWTGKQPIRLVLDRQRNLPESLILFNKAIPTLIFTEVPAKSVKNLTWVPLDFSKNGIEQIMNDLYKRDIHSLLVEGGAQVHESFLKAGVYDELQIEVSCQQIGRGVKAPDLSGYSIALMSSLQYNADAEGRVVRVFYPCEHT